MTKSIRSLHWCRSISKKISGQVLLQYQSKSYYIIGQEVYYSIGRFITLSGSYYIIGRFLLHYRAVITVSGVYYIIGWYNVSMPTTRIWCYPPAMWVSDSVTRCQSRIVTKQSLHGLKALSVDLEREKAKLEWPWWPMWNIGSAQYLVADHDDIILLPRLPFLFLYYDYWSFYNVTFMLEIIVVNCIAFLQDKYYL